MTQSPKLRFLNGFKGEQKGSNQPNNVQGWLMNVHSYREPEERLIVDENNNSIGNPRRDRNGRAGSITSEDSVNLDELINANYTTDMDDETALPDFEGIDSDLDDSKDEFWTLDKNNSRDTSFDSFITSKSINELDWSPTDTDANNLKASLPVTPSSEKNRNLNRSGSFSSENSLTSQSTITQYAKYGLAPMMYPSESSSASSRSLSRQSNYSTTSSTSGIRTNTTSNTGIPTPSRSFTLKKGSTQRTPLAKRASHIPAPASTLSPPTPQRTISTSSANSRLRIPTQKRIPQRASHIPTVRESIHRPNSPLQQQQGRQSAASSRIGMQSPTPGGPRNSLFPPKQKEEIKNTTTVRQSGIRLPGSSTRSPSRISTLKRTT